MVLNGSISADSGWFLKYLDSIYFCLWLVLNGSVWFCQGSGQFPWSDVDTLIVYYVLRLMVQSYSARFGLVVKLLWLGLLLFLIGSQWFNLVLPGSGCFLSRLWSASLVSGCSRWFNLALPSSGWSWIGFKWFFLLLTGSLVLMCSSTLRLCFLVLYFSFYFDLVDSGFRLILTRHYCKGTVSLGLGFDFRCIKLTQTFCKTAYCFYILVFHISFKKIEFGTASLTMLTISAGFTENRKWVPKSC